jgi:hypothetical protein
MAGIMSSTVKGGPNTITENLIFSFDAANRKSYPATGTAITDLSGNGSNGILTNGPTFDSANNGSIQFDGLDDYIELGSIDSTHPLSLNNQENISWEFWFKPTTTGDPYQRIIDKSNSGNALNGWGIFVNNNPPTNKRIAIFINNNAIIDYIGDDGYQYDEWNHITITKGSTYGWTYKLYNNANLITTATGKSAQFPTTTTNCRIGTWNHSTGREFKGNLGLINIYQKTFEADEVLQNYNATKRRYQ